MKKLLLLSLAISTATMAAESGASTLLQKYDAKCNKGSSYWEYFNPYSNRGGECKAMWDDVTKSVNETVLDNESLKSKIQTQETQANNTQETQANNTNADSASYLGGLYSNVNKALSQVNNLLLSYSAGDENSSFKHINARNLLGLAALGAMATAAHQYGVPSKIGSLLGFGGNTPKEEDDTTQVQTAQKDAPKTKSMNKRLIRIKNIKNRSNFATT
jgi:hypothetical protein